MKKLIDEIIDILNNISDDEYSTMIECARKLGSGQLLDTMIARVVDYDWDNEDLKRINNEKGISIEKMAWTLLGAKLYKGDKNSIREFVDMMRECNSIESTKANTSTNIGGIPTPTPDEKKKSNSITPLF